MRQPPLSYFLVTVGTVRFSTQHRTVFGSSHWNTILFRREYVYLSIRDIYAAVGDCVRYNGSNNTMEMLLAALSECGSLAATLAGRSGLRHLGIVWAILSTYQLRATQIALYSSRVVAYSSFVTFRETRTIHK